MVMVIIVAAEFVFGLYLSTVFAPIMQLPLPWPVVLIILMVVGFTVIFLGLIGLIRIFVTKLFDRYSGSD